MHFNRNNINRLSKPTIYDTRLLYKSGSILNETQSFSFSKFKGPGIKRAFRQSRHESSRPLAVRLENSKGLNQLPLISCSQPGATGESAGGNLRGTHPMKALKESLDTLPLSKQSNHCSRADRAGNRMWQHTGRGGGGSRCSQSQWAAADLAEISSSMTDKTFGSHRAHPLPTSSNKPMPWKHLGHQELMGKEPLAMVKWKGGQIVAFGTTNCCAHAWWSHPLLCIHGEQSKHQQSSGSTRREREKRRTYLKYYTYQGQCSAEQALWECKLHSSPSPLRLPDEYNHWLQPAARRSHQRATSALPTRAKCGTCGLFPPPPYHLSVLHWFWCRGSGVVVDINLFRLRDDDGEMSLY